MTTADLADQGGAIDADEQGAADDDGELQPLLPASEGGGFRDRWREIQTKFVDAPRNSVSEADELVAELMQRLAQTFAQERQNLEAEWDRGSDVSTEELRVALQRYRSFFERLLAT